MANAALGRIDKQLSDLEPGSLRHQVLSALRQFRASWVELGRLLTDVAYGGDYKEWGYDDFEVYCARELGLKKPTVKKLMVSFNYMKKYEPQRLDSLADEEETAPFSVPDYQTVELLHRARQREDLDETEKEELHQQAFSGEEEEGQLRKRLRSALRPGGEEDISAANGRRRGELDDILRTARLLRRKLAEAKSVPAGLKAKFEQLLVELEAID